MLVLIIENMANNTMYIVQELHTLYDHSKSNLFILLHLFVLILKG